jgi:hypothetical protein
MTSRIKNWTRRTVWKVACWLAATQGVNLNRAIYVGAQDVTLEWKNGFSSGNRIAGAEIAMCFSPSGMTVSTVFGEAS